jgi:hypothetical protein
MRCCERCCAVEHCVTGCTEAIMSPQSDVITQDSKRTKVSTAVSDAAHAVQRTNLQLILQYVGLGDWFYTGAVSREWQQVYRRICEDSAKQQKLWVLKGGKRRHVQPVAAASTYFTRALSSLSRLQLADAAGLRLDIVECLPQQAGRVADKRTLLWAHENWMPWFEQLSESMARSGRLGMLQWLRVETSCPLHKSRIVRAALERADLPMLKWLHGQLSHSTFSDAATQCCYNCIGTACVGSIAVLAWLQVKL